MIRPSPLALLAVAACLVAALLRPRPAAASAAEEAKPPRAVECTPRRGLPNVLAKLKTPGAEVHVPVLGASNTAQEGWRPKSLAYLQKEYPDAKLIEISAAIGGTGSDLGVFRL